MCHGYRSAFRNLLVEKRDDAAAASEDVSKPNTGKVPPISILGIVLNQDLPDSLCRTHDARRIDSLICRNEYKALDARLAARLEQHLSPVYIVEHRLTRMFFH
jgi:hypothetical protein